MESTVQNHQQIENEQGVSLDVKIAQFAGELLTREDLFLVDVNVRGRKGSRVVEVYIDGDEGVNVDDLAALSRELAFLMDAEDVIKGKYHLNVSSPGDERALAIERQYARHTGKTIEVFVNRDEGGNWVEGENLGINEGVLSLRKSKAVEEIPMDLVTKARIKLPW